MMMVLELLSADDCFKLLSASLSAFASFNEWKQAASVSSLSLSHTISLSHTLSVSLSLSLSLSLDVCCVATNAGVAQLHISTVCRCTKIILPVVFSLSVSHTLTRIPSHPCAPTHSRLTHACSHLPANIVQTFYVYIHTHIFCK